MKFKAMLDEVKKEVEESRGKGVSFTSLLASAQKGKKPEKKEEKDVSLKL